MSESPPMTDPTQQAPEPETPTTEAGKLAVQVLRGDRTDYGRLYASNPERLILQVEKAAVMWGAAARDAEVAALREALRTLAEAKRQVSACPTPGNCMYPQHHSDDETRAEFADRLQRTARAALAAEPVSATPVDPAMLEWALRQVDWEELAYLAPPAAQRGYFDWQRLDAIFARLAAAATPPAETWE